MNRGTEVKIVITSLAAIVLLWLVSTLMAGSGTGFTMNMSGNIMGNAYKGGIQMGNGAYYASTGIFLLTILIKILLAVFVIGLVGGIVILVRNYIFTADDKEKLKRAFSFKKQPAKVITCSYCGKTLSEDWKVCPYCGGNEVKTEFNAEVI